LFYLMPSMLVAAAGDLKLWITQRRERPDAGAIDAYRAGIPS
jgi:hypothetical protein